MPGSSRSVQTSPDLLSPPSRLLGLEVVRALAITTVLLYHLNLNDFFNAGFLGVDIFFSLSGFLITCLLLRDVDAEGRVRIGAFYLRRIKRLYPACAAMMLSCAVLSPLLTPESVDRLHQDLPGAVFYVSNWWQIYSEQSYFANFGHPPLLQHLWSLAVEEQFYIVWPLVLLTLLSVVGTRGLGWICLGCAMASSWWMAQVYQLRVDMNDPSRAYLGTDTHAMGLLLGAALACFWSPWQHRSASVMAVVTRWRVPLAVGAAGALITLTWVLHEGHPLLFRGGFLGVGVCTLLLIVALTDLADEGSTAPPMTRWGVTAIRWLGTRSYSIYLWHWPIFIVGQVNPTQSWGAIAACLGVTALISEISYRWVEQPFQRWITIDRPRSVHQLLTGMALSILVLLMVSAPALRRIFLEGDAVSASPSRQADPTERPDIPSADGQTASTASLADSAPAVAATETVVTISDQPAAQVGTKVMVVGDSVMLGASHYLLRHYPGVVVDAMMGRQAHHGLQVIQQLRQQHAHIDHVVVHLGTNGYIVESQFVQLLKALSDIKHITVFNVYANRRWMKPNNDIIERVTPNFPNVRVVDWHQMGMNNPNYFVSDGIHLTSAGIIAIGNEISRMTGLTFQNPAPRTVAVRIAKARPVQTAGVGSESPAPSPQARLVTGQPQWPSLVESDSGEIKPGTEKDPP